MMGVNPPLNEVVLSSYVLVPYGFLAVRLQHLDELHTKPAFGCVLP